MHDPVKESSEVRSAQGAAPASQAPASVGPRSAAANRVGQAREGSAGNESVHLSDEDDHEGGESHFTLAEHHDDDPVTPARPERPAAAAYSKEEADKKAQELIDRNTNWGGLNLKEESLGKQLAPQLKDHPELLAAVLDKLGSTDRDDVSLNTTKNLSDDDLRQLSQTEEGRKALDRMRGELTSDLHPSPTLDQGHMGDDEALQAQRIDRALRPEAGAGAPGSAATAEATPIPEGIPPAPPGVDVDQNIKDAQGNLNPKWFYDKVRNNGDWDYKQRGSEYADFGNFNYGATCLASGFSEETCLAEAGRAQVQAGTSDPSYGHPGERGNPFSHGTGSYGDDPRDQEMIKRGFEYYKAHHPQPVHHHPGPHPR